MTCKEDFKYSSHQSYISKLQYIMCLKEKKVKKIFEVRETTTKDQTDLGEKSTSKKWRVHRIGSKIGWLNGGTWQVVRWNSRRVNYKTEKKELSSVLAIFVIWSETFPSVTVWSRKWRNEKKRLFS